MKMKKTACVSAAVLGMVAVCAGDAAAQADFTPSLRLSANGNSVTIEWTPVTGALGYHLEVGSSPNSANVASVNVPASLPCNGNGCRIVVAAPAGTYYMRVRGLTLTLQGPFSPVQSITVGGGGSTPGPGGCTQPAAPNVNANVSGGSVTVSWNSVSGTLGYRVELSRSSGRTEFTQIVGASQTSFTQQIGVPGTYYVRVISGNQCGTTASAEVSFRIGTPGPSGPGSGPRTPNPPAGQMLPLPSYGQAVMEQVARQFSGDLANACNSRAYLFRLLNALRQYDSRWGLNYKRGQHGDLSTDIITYNGTSNPDEGESHVYLVDVVGAICEGNHAAWGWEEATHQTWAARGHPACGTEWCAKWTIAEYLAAGFPRDSRQR
jgi:hypothetical protein